jgi:ribosomal protein L29
MKAKEIKTKNDAELTKMLTEARTKLRDFSFGMTGSQGKNTKTGRETKRGIARILTELTLRSKKA